MLKPLRVPFHGLTSWLPFTKILSYFGYYDEVLDTFSMLSKMSRVILVHPLHGPIIKNLCKRHFWHPYSKRLSHLNFYNIRDLLVPERSEENYKGYITAICPFLTRELMIRESSRSMTTVIKGMLVEVHEELEGRILFRGPMLYMHTVFWGCLVAVVVARQWDEYKPDLKFF